MKRIKIIVSLFLITLFGCTDDDDNQGFFYELVTIEQASLPDQFVRGQTYAIDVSYFRPSDCHSFVGFDYNRLGNERTVAVVNLVVDEAGRDCTDLEQTDLVDASFNFIVGFETSYIFRFWQGRDDNGTNQFLIIEVPVVES